MRCCTHLAALLLVVAGAVASAAEKPNVLIFLCDDTGYAEFGFQAIGVGLLANAGEHMRAARDGARDGRAADAGGCARHHDGAIERALGHLNRYVTRPLVRS